MVSYTKSLSPLPSAEDGQRERETRLQKYALQDAARDILPPEDRVFWCMRARSAHIPSVEVWRDIARGTAHYRGLVVCSQVWTCPLCAAKITERRRQELQNAFATFTASGGILALVTSTIPHGTEDALIDLLTRLARARMLSRGGKAAAAIRKDVGLLGTIRCLEVTHSFAHSWHPHIHEIWAMVKPFDLQELQCQLAERWRSAAVKAGFREPSIEHGVDVRGGQAAAAYIAKWGAL